MIVIKAQKHSNQPRVVHCQSSADIETTSSGIRASEDNIRVCAYYIYQKRGTAFGNDAQDWAQAERIMSRL
jgi:hypothetical protein